MPSPEEVDHALAEKLKDLQESAGWQKALAWAREQREIEAQRKSGKSSSQIPKNPEPEVLPKIEARRRAPKRWPEHILAEPGVVLTYRFDESKPLQHSHL